MINVMFSLLLKCLDDILPTHTHVINTSILSGQLSANMKTAIVKPLLEKKSWKIIDLCKIYLSSQIFFLKLFSSNL